MTTLRAGRLAACAAAAILLSACGGSAGVDHHRQDVSWSACDPAAIDSTGFAQEVAALGARLQCGTVRVPLKHDDPSGGDITLRLARIAAADPTRKAGLLVLHAGGPGYDGLDMGTYLTSSANDEEGGRPRFPGLRQFTDRYDLVAFTARGAGGPDAFECEGTGGANVGVGADLSPENIQAKVSEARALAEGCMRHPMAASMRSDFGMKDLDIIRAVLKQDKLNFFGASYGTIIGLWYAATYPERVGRMVLDSVPEYAPALVDMLRNQPRAQQWIHDEIVAPYALDQSRFVDVGASLTEVRTILLDAPDWLRQWATGEVLELMVTSWDLDETVAYLAVVKALTGLLEAHPTSTPEALQQASDAHVYASDPWYAATTRRIADRLVEVYGWPPVLVGETQVEAWRMDAFDSVFMATVCNEGTGGDLAAWIRTSSEQAQRFPLSGGDISPCAFWKPQAITKPPLARATTAVPILVLHSEFDGRTPYEAAKRTIAQLPNARLLTVRGDYMHAIWPYGSACVDGAVHDYLLSGRLPATLECPSAFVPAAAASVSRTFARDTHRAPRAEGNRLAPKPWASRGDGQRPTLEAPMKRPVR